MPTSRRSFLTGSLAAGGLLQMASRSWAALLPDESSWGCPVLGDLHIDKLDHHDLEWLKKEHPGDVSQVQNYSRITSDMTPRLLEVVRSQIRSSDSTVPFIIQLGDLIEGLCGTPELAERQANDALELLARADLGKPLLITKGNHDITGPGAADVYDRVFLPFMTAGAGRKIQSAAFERAAEGILLVFYDAYRKESLNWFERLLAEHPNNRIIFVIHPPVVPYNARSSWHVYSSPRQANERQRLLNLLGRSQAIVLSGHMHKYNFLARRTDEGGFVQLGLSSVASSTDGSPRVQLDGLEHYGPGLVDLEPQHSPDTLDRRQDLLRLEKPLIQHYEYADTWGHVWLSVSAKNVQVNVYRGFTTEPWKTIDVNQYLTDL